MKIRTLKIIWLAGVLALCLLLTGCYQPPDEVNNGQPIGAVTTSFFNTLAPTPTVTMTPDTVVIETQNIFNGQNGGQTTPTPTQPSGGGNGWDNWGTAQTTLPGSTDGIQTVTPAPSEAGATIEVVTSEPPTPPPTPTPTPGPTPTPKSLQRGYKGSDAVRSVQKRLKELGYYDGPVTGHYDDLSKRAFSDYCGVENYEERICEGDFFDERVLDILLKKA